MTTSAYVINAVLVLLVVRQVREHPLDARNLGVPVLAVAVAAHLFLRSVPTAGGDLALELACIGLGVTMGTLAGLATHVRVGVDGRAMARAGWVAAGLWVAGVGGRLAFAVAASHGAGPMIARFSAGHAITGSDAWVAALVMMAFADVLSRLLVLALRGRRTEGLGGPVRVRPVNA